MRTEFHPRLAASALLLLLCANAWGDIYVYVDANGVPNFTDSPSDSRYRLFLKDGVETGSRYGPEIRHAASMSGVDAALIQAVIRTESGFDPKAVSVKGARGLMQLMPDTARIYGVEDAFDPEQNIQAGARHLGRLLSRFDGNLPLALAAYNAGENAVLKYGRVPPYNETTHYVSKVLSLYKRYSQIPR